MRRKDREVTDRNAIIDIMRECPVCRVGFCDEGEVYIVPHNFGFTDIDGVTTLYFHSAREGRKISLIKKSPKVGFEMETAYKLSPGTEGIGCECTASFKSIIGNGDISIVTDEEEKLCGLKSILEHTTKKDAWTFEQRMVDITTVIKLEITGMTCKFHE